MAVSVNGGELEFNAVINAGQFNAAITQIERQLSSLTKKSEDQVKGIDELVRKTTLAIGTYASFSTATNFIGDIVRTRGEFQKLEVSFNTMLKSKERADKLLAQAVELAAKTPFTLQDVGSAAKQLLAYGFGAETVTKNIEMLGNVAAGVGAPLGDIVYLYGTLRTQGRAYQKDIMQFTGRGIPIVAELAKIFGVTQEEVSKLVEAGKVGFPQVEQAFKNLTSQSGLFFNLMQEQSKTLTGQISNLEDAWSRMLNDIGKSNEGVFSTAIQSAIAVVENYQDVLDILKVLVATYGTYRAAIIVTNVATALSTALTKGWTVAELLRFKAMVLSERAMKILNATMLSNPAVAIATGIALLASALLVFRNRSDAAGESQKRLNAIKTESLKTIDAEKTKLETLLKVARDETKSKEARESAIRKINQISPEYLGNLTLENIKTGEATAAINNYIKALERKAQAQAAENALTDISQRQFDEQLKMINKIDERRKRLGYGQLKGPDGRLIKAEVFDDDPIVKEIREQFSEENKLLEDQKNKIKQVYGDALTQQITGEGEKQKAKLRTIEVIDEEIKALQEQQKAVSTNAKQYQDFQKKINALEKEKLAITGDKKAIKEQEKNYNQRLNDIKQLLSDINNAESDARQSGMLKEQSQIDQINERYGQLKDRARELKAGEGVLQRIENARVKQVGNVKEKEAFELYKKSLQDQKALFDQFEEYRVRLGEEKSRELLGIQQDDFSDYLSYLQAELLKVSRSNEASTLGGKLKIQFLTDAIVQAEKDKAKQIIDDQARAYAEMINATISFEDQRNAIIEKYRKIQETLEADVTVTNKEQRSAFLKQAMDEELADLQEYANRQTDVFKKLNQDLLFVTRDGLKKRRDEIKKMLAENANLTPALRQALEQALEQVDELLKSTGELFGLTLKELQKIQEYADLAQSVFSQLSSAFNGLDDDLSATLETMSDMAGVLGSIAQTAAGIASGNIGGIVSGVVGIISGIVNIVKKVKASVAEARREVDAFYTGLYNGEMEVNRLYRERAREQATINKLKLQGIADEMKLLKEQKKQIEDQFKSTLALLQQQTAVVGMRTEKYGGFLGIGRKTRAVDIVESLAGKSFDELEQLFLKGQLEGKAKELFEQLQKIKQEGIDVDALLEENAEEARQIFTGTTAGGIVDAIADGFKNGKRSAADFADTFEELMKDAIFNSLKFQALEGPLKDFYTQFAEFAQTDGILTSQEIDQLRNNFSNIIGNAQQQFDQLQQITSMNLSGTTSNSPTNLTGAIKGITEQQANLLAGQFGGLRLTALDHLNVARSSLQIQQKTQVNTGLTAERLTIVIERMQYYFETVGVKIK